MQHLINKYILHSLNKILVFKIVNMSDTDSDTLSISSNSSISNEINKILNSCEEIYTQINNSFETLENIETLIQNNKTIIISNENWSGDFDEILEIIHNESIQNIKENGSNIFGEKLLNILVNYKFHI
jgi:hypothetical protein